MLNRVAKVAFPSSAIVIITVWAVQAASGLEIPDFVSAAATGLLTYLAFVAIGAGEHTDKE